MREGDPAACIRSLLGAARLDGIDAGRGRWYEGGAAGHFGAFDGTVDVPRLDVWSTPHRPFETTSPAPSARPPPPHSSP